MFKEKMNLVMRVVEFPNQFTKPSFNLSLDHALFLNHHQSKVLWIRYWVNEPSVILGKSQELNREVSIQKCNQHDIDVKRRISGGGAVYHDLGNLNVSLVFDLAFFRKRTLPEAIRTCLQSSRFSLENMYPSHDFRIEGTSLFMDGKKISGSAAYKKGTKVLYHFTILVDVNLELLHEVLLSRNPNPKSSRESKYAPTINIRNFDFNQWRNQFLYSLAPFIEKAGNAIWNKNVGTISLNPQNDPKLKIEDFGEKTIALAEFLDGNIYSNENWINNGKWARIYNDVRRKANPSLGYNPF